MSLSLKLSRFAILLCRFRWIACSSKLILRSLRQFLFAENATNRLTSKKSLARSANYAAFQSMRSAAKPPKISIASSICQNRLLVLQHEFGDLGVLAVKSFPDSHRIGNCFCWESFGKLR